MTESDKAAHGDGAYELLPVDVSPELQAILHAHPLPEGVDDADMSLAEFAAAMQTSENTVGKWIRAPKKGDGVDPGFPMVREGGQGKAHVIRLSHGWAYRQWVAAEEKTRADRSRRATMELQASMLGLDLDAGEPVVSPAMRKQLAEADLVWGQAELRRGRLIETQGMVELLQSLFVIVRNGLEGMPDRLERELALKPQQVDLVQRAANDMLKKFISEIEENHLAGFEGEMPDIEKKVLI